MDEIDTMRAELATLREEITELRRAHAVARAEQEIRALKQRYLRACDAKDVAGFRACFVRAGGTLDYGPLGRMDPDGMAQVFSSIALAVLDDGSPAVLDMHHAFMASISVSESAAGAAPEHATGTWSLQFRQLDRASGVERFTVGRYEDEYVVEDGVWVMRRCDFHVDWTLTRPLDGARVDR